MNDTRRAQTQQPTRRPWRRWALGALLISALGHVLTLLWAQGHLNWSASAASPVVTNVQLIELTPSPTAPLALQHALPAAKPRRKAPALTDPNATIEQAPPVVEKSVENLDNQAAPDTPPSLEQAMPSFHPNNQTAFPDPKKIDFDISIQIRKAFGLTLNSTAELFWQFNATQFLIMLREERFGYLWRTYGSIDNNGLHPLRWEDRLGSRKSLRGVTYAPETKEIMFSAGNKVVSYVEGVQNNPSILLHLGALVRKEPALQQAGAGFKLAVTDAKDLREFTIQCKGKETIQTRFGPVETLAYTSLQSEGNNESGIVVWLSPAHDFLPMQFRVFDDGNVLEAIARLITHLPHLPDKASPAEVPDWPAPTPRPAPPVSAPNES